ncbi:MAG: formylglycine-generating enzyme family protein [Gemmataceae bacterium]|nr:formylglycine-generating enzyme family protein [Gemmataceae bacterium]
MESRFRDTVDGWRASFTRLSSPTAPGHRIWQEITGGFRCIKAGDCYFGADHLAYPPNPGTPKWVEAFELHQYLITNEMYELFDPSHNAARWDGGPHPRLMRLEKPKTGKVTSSGDERCPVVNVTFFDAFAYAAWCGCRLPTSEEWEHAYRAGTAFRYWSEGSDWRLNGGAWLDKNSGGMTHPVGLWGKSRLNGLFDMAGNVWEWCGGWDNSELKQRFIRGGSWDDPLDCCRAAFHGSLKPSIRGLNCGFRLCRPGPG